MSKLEDVRLNVEKGKTKLIAGIVQEAIDEGNSANDILDTMIEAMGTVGDKFSSGELFVPEMLIAAKAMSKGVEVLKPLLAAEDTKSLGTCVIGTVAGDLHDIGKNLVTMMIESAGFTVVDLGVDVSVDQFIEATKENDNVKIVALSALLTTTMPALKETVKKLKENSDAYKVIVGGAPISKEFAEEIGADGFAPDAGGAAVKAKELVA